MRLTQDQLKKIQEKIFPKIKMRGQATLVQNDDETISIKTTSSSIDFSDLGSLIENIKALEEMKDNDSPVEAKITTGSTAEVNLTIKFSLKTSKKIIEKNLAEESLIPKLLSFFKSPKPQANIAENKSKLPEAESKSATPFDLKIITTHELITIKEKFFRAINLNLSSNRSKWKFNESMSQLNIVNDGFVILHPFDKNSIQNFDAELIQNSITAINPKIECTVNIAESNVPEFLPTLIIKFTPNTSLELVKIFLAHNQEYIPFKQSLLAKLETYPAANKFIEKEEQQQLIFETTAYGEAGSANGFDSPNSSNLRIAKLILAIQMLLCAIENQGIFSFKQKGTCIFITFFSEHDEKNAQLTTKLLSCFFNTDIIFLNGLHDFNVGRKNRCYEINIQSLHGIGQVGEKNMENLLKNGPPLTLSQVADKDVQQQIEINKLSGMLRIKSDEKSSWFELILQRKDGTFYRTLIASEFAMERACHSLGLATSQLMVKLQDMIETSGFFKDNYNRQSAEVFLKESRGIKGIFRNGSEYTYIFSWLEKNNEIIHYEIKTEQDAGKFLAAAYLNNDVSKNNSENTRSFSP